ncbi:MAG: ubiquinone/menaquinone biosynthesis C-methylase UbiE [Myxococcota bacterium]|jgi:ubiquinone/menaquinone biosynthesis C-methylase UbiE
MQSADDFLQAFHSTHPGATDEAFGSGTVEGGLSSYELLARFIAEAADGEPVMDLACGDGALAARILAQPNPPAVVVAVDPSAAELKKAKRRIRRQAVFHRCAAQDLPSPSAEFAAVGCHMALMLLDPVEEAIAQVARVLVPGGAFGVIVPSGEHLSPLYKRYIALLREHTVDRPRLGDPRTRSEAGLRELLEAFDRVEIGEHTLSMRGTTEALWEQTLSTSYDVFALPEEARAAVRAGVLASGEQELSMGLRFVRAWTAPQG